MYFKGCDLPCEERAKDTGLYSSYRCNEESCDTDMCNTMSLKEATEKGGGVDAGQEETVVENLVIEAPENLVVSEEEQEETAEGESDLGEGDYQVEEGKSVSEDTGNNGDEALSIKLCTIVLAVLFSIM